MKRVEKEEPEYWEEIQEEKRRRKNPAYKDKRWSEGNVLDNWIRSNLIRSFQTSPADLDGLDVVEEEEEEEGGGGGRDSSDGTDVSDETS
jgi:hypothetical protein